MPLYNIPVVYQMFGVYKGVEADTLAQAKEKVFLIPGTPSEPSYIDDSLEVDEASIEIYNRENLA